MDKKTFDQLIREKLQGIQPVPSSSSWEELESRMSSAEGPTNASDFDQAISEKLHDLAPVIPPADWDRMATALSQAEAQEFDQQIEEKLHRVPLVQSSEATWPLLARTLQIQSLFRNRLFQGKALEVAVLLLLLLLFQEGLFRQDNPGNQGLKTHIAGSYPVQENAPGQSSSLNTKPQQGLFPMAEISVKTDRTAPAPPNTTDSSNPLHSSDLAAHSLFAKPAEEKNQQEESSAAASSLVLPTDHQAPQHIPNEAIPVGVDLVLLPNKFELLESEKSQFPPLGPYKTVTIKPKKSKVGFVLSVLGGAEVYQIQTPSDPAFDDGAFQNYDEGYLGGLNLNLYKGRWGLGIGAAYASLSYEPREKKEIFDGSLTRGGYFLNELSNISFNFIQIPLQVNYAAFRGKQWQLSPYAGIQFAAALDAHYDLKTTFVPARAITAPPGGEEQNPSPDPDKVSVLQERIQDRGLLAGGNLVDNYIFSGTGGIRFDYQFSKRYGVLAQIGYIHQLSRMGIGPNKDSFNSLSTKIGLSIRL